VSSGLRDRLAIDRDVVRTALLDKQPGPADAIPRTDPDVRTPWGNYLHHPALEGWAGEHLTDFNKWVKFIHTKIILIDPLTATPTIITGSANYSDNSTTDNEENTLVIRGDGTPTTQRVADIYLTEYQRLFMHFVYRDWANPDTIANAGTDSSAGHLRENPTWSAPYYTAGSWRERQRRTFASTTS